MQAPSSLAELVPHLVAARRDLGWSQGRLAAELDLSENAIGCWERGTRIPARSNAQRWADAVGVELPANTDGWFTKATHYKVPPHGTRNGAHRHRDRKEQVCAPCLAAEAAYVAAWRAQRRSRQHKTAPAVVNA